MAKSPTSKVTPAQERLLERGLSDLYVARTCLSISDEIGRGELVPAITALIQKSGASIELALREAEILSGPAIVGGVADWMDISCADGQGGLSHD